MHSPVALGQVVYWVNGSGKERSGIVVGCFGEDLRVEVKDERGWPMVLPFYTTEVFETQVDAWEARQALVKARALSARETLASMLSEHSRAASRIAELRRAAAAEVV